MLNPHPPFVLYGVSQRRQLARRWDDLYVDPVLDREVPLQTHISWLFLVRILGTDQRLEDRT